MKRPLAACLIARLIGYDGGMPRSIRLLRLSASILAGIALANLVVLIAVSDWFGGSASQGKVVGERYYLGNHRDVEVSESTYRFIYAEERIALVAVPVGVASVAFWLWTSKRYGNTKEPYTMGNCSQN
jgi:hypothetical protein